MFFFGLLTILVLSAYIFLIPTAVWFVVWLIAKRKGRRTPFKPYALCGAVMIAISWMMCAYGYFEGRFKLDVNRMEYTNASLPPAFDGYRIVHISDLHLDSFGSHTEAVERVVDSINALGPDLVCFTGDIVNESPDALKPYLPIIAKIHAPDGVLSVLGNHGFFIYSREYETDQQRDSATAEVVKLEESIGWRVLRNAHTVIHRGNDSITVIGVDNTNMDKSQGVKLLPRRGFKTIQKGDLKRAMKGAGGFMILLSHDPTHWRNQVITETDIPLTLSGHTHSAQMRICGWTPAYLMFTDACGLSVEGGQTLYVSSGIGCTLPSRIGANQEITLFTLRR